MAQARSSWVSMIEAAQDRGVKLILLKPTADVTQQPDAPAEDALPLQQHAEQIRRLAAEYGTGLADSLAGFRSYQQRGDLSDLLGWINHPNRSGHELVAQELLRWFPIA